MPGAPGIQMNVPAIYHNVLPPNITPLLSPRHPKPITFYVYWQSNNSSDKWDNHMQPHPCRPHNGHPPQNQRIPLLCVTEPLKWPHRVGVLNPNSRGHTKVWENFARRTRRALTYSLRPKTLKHRWWTKILVAAINTKSKSQHLKPLCDMPQAHHKQTRDFYKGPAKGAPFCDPPPRPKNWGLRSPPPPPPGQHLSRCRTPPPHIGKLFFSQKNEMRHRGRKFEADI